MNKTHFVYLDQNILQYNFEEGLHVESNDEFEWVFSNEHFYEINRNEDHRFFAVLKQLRARKIELQLDKEFRYTNQGTVLEYSDPIELYRKFKDAIQDVDVASFSFNPLQAFFNGNRTAIDPALYAQQFETYLLDLIGEAADVGLTDLLSTNIRNDVSVLSKKLGDTLVSAQEQIEPLSKMRKRLSTLQLSNLDPAKGSIIDQIWEEIEGSVPFSKEQFFGKEQLPVFDNEPSNSPRPQPVYYGIVQCYQMLNFLGYWPDEGLPREHKTYGINSDASHVAYGAFCRGFLSADDRLCKKARVIYEFFDCGTTVLQLEFVERP